MLVLWLVLMPLPLWAEEIDITEIGRDIDDLPLFDAHVHYKKEAWGPLPPESVITLMDRSGVALALVSSTPDEGTIRLWQHAPQRVVPELRPYHDGYGSSNWMEMPDMEGYLRGRLQRYSHQGLGEFHIHELAAENLTLLRRVVDLAREYNILLHVHSGSEAVVALYKMSADITVLWAHAGMTAEPEEIEQMMARYPTLHADTSYREADILAGGIEVIEHRWSDLISRFPDRFLIGSDTWVNSQWANYADIIAENRRWLSFFSREIAEQIAYKNGERLFGRKVSAALIGKR